jgi:hypothetical protein
MTQNRDALLRDAAYFASELSRRLEMLCDQEQDGQLTTIWQQAGGMARRIRGVLRKQADHERAVRRALERRAQAGVRA